MIEPDKELTDVELIEKARKIYESDGVEIDAIPKVSRSDGGAFIAAWVWVYD